MIQITPAYTTVSARQQFTRPVPVSHSPAHSTTSPGSASVTTEKPRREWPPQVRLYVQRAFAADPEGVSRAELEEKLKRVISEAAESNTLVTTDWEALPLPQQLINEERRSTVVTLSSPWRNQTTSLNLQETNTFSPSSSTSTSTSSKKRKSTEHLPGQLDENVIPPWRAANSNALEDRVSYADKRPRNDPKPTSKSQFNLESRKRRFESGNNGYPSPGPYSSSKDGSPFPDIDQGPIIGRCQELEKRYFRLTSAPNPDKVRPLPVLEKTLELLKRKWKKESNYSYICDQFKSLRQDLTVQHIKTDFTVNVYEIHARIALEKGDLGEYNQCQTQLRVLYSQKLGGHPTEFKAYRILYFIHTCNRTDMNDVLADLTPAEKKSRAVKHALDARSALALGNYHRFFQLYLETPNMGAYLMDMFVTRERLAALSNICRAYKPDVKLRFITEELGFESDEESARFLCDHEAQAFLEEREDGVRLLTGKVGNVIEGARAASFKKVDIKGQI